MKYLSEIMEHRQSKLFKEKKVFFAFSNEQFKEGVEKHKLTKENKMVKMGGGMFCPSGNVKEVIDQMDLIYKESIIEDMKQGKEKVILRELGNHECFYTGDYSDCINKLEDYPIKKSEIKEVFYKNYQAECSKF